MYIYELITKLNHGKTSHQKLIIYINIFIILILFILIIVGSISNDDPKRYILKHFQKLLMKTQLILSIYLILLLLWCDKSPVTIINLYDISQLFPNKKKSFFVSQTSQKNVLYIFSYIGFLFAVFQLVTMILLVFFPISKVYYTHSHYSSNDFPKFSY